MPENAEIYTNSQLALALFEVLEEMIADGTVPEELAYGLLAQLDKSILKSLKDEVPAKAEIKGHLDNYKYFDNVWQFGLKQDRDPKTHEPIPVTFKLSATGTGSMKKALMVSCERMKVTCADVKVALGETA